MTRAPAAQPARELRRRGRRGADDEPGRRRRRVVGLGVRVGQPRAVARDDGARPRRGRALGRRALRPGRGTTAEPTSISPPSGSSRWCTRLRAMSPVDVEAGMMAAVLFGGRARALPRAAARRRLARRTTADVGTGAGRQPRRGRAGRACRCASTPTGARSTTRGSRCSAAARRSPAPASWPMRSSADRSATARALDARALVAALGAAGRQAARWPIRRRPR